MPQYTYKRDAVPMGAQINLEVQFADAKGNPKDADATPSIEITDASNVTVVAATTTSVIRRGVGDYRFQYTVHDGYQEGIWNDTWVGVLDGYVITNTFDFTVNSQGSIEAVITIVEPLVALGDDPTPEALTQVEIKNINKVLDVLRIRLRSTAFKPDGSRCDVFSVDQLVKFLNASLSEFNATPTITFYTFADPIVPQLFTDILSQGAMLIAWAGQAVLESGNEWQINDNGVTINPPPIASSITAMYNAQMSDYRGKLKEIKRNLRPSPIGMGAGSLMVGNTRVRNLRHLREKQIF